MKTIKFLRRNHLNYTKKDTIMHVKILFFQNKGKQEQAG